MGNRSSSKIIELEEKYLDAKGATEACLNSLHDEVHRSEEIKRSMASIEERYINAKEFEAKCLIKYNKELMNRVVS